MNKLPGRSEADFQKQEKLIKPKKRNKYRAKRTYSKSLERWFDSKAEANRADELMMVQKLGGIGHLHFQRKFVLSEKPKVTIKIDFSYVEDGKKIYEDVKGVLTREFRVKLAWLKQLRNIDVRLTK